MSALHDRELADTIEADRAGRKRVLTVAVPRRRPRPSTPFRCGYCGAPCRGWVCAAHEDLLGTDQSHPHGFASVSAGGSRGNGG